MEIGTHRVKRRPCKTVGDKLGVERVSQPIYDKTPGVFSSGVLSFFMIVLLRLGVIGSC